MKSQSQTNVTVQLYSKHLLFAIDKTVYTNKLAVAICPQKSRLLDKKLQSLYLL